MRTLADKIMEATEQHIIDIVQQHFKVSHLNDLHINKVTRLDSPGGYFLASFKADGDPGYRIAIIDEQEDKVVQSAMVQQVNDLNVYNKLEELGIQKDAAIRLVWKPSKLSFSPFYPFFEVKTVDDSFYLTQEGQQFRELPSGRG